MVNGVCGIVGYIGRKQAAPILLKGLRRLEYRGYDSAGFAVVNGALEVRKGKGKIDRVNAYHRLDKIAGTMGIAHTRWATHGEPSQKNAHPHTSAAGDIALVHNGIVENAEKLRAHLVADGAW